MKRRLKEQFRHDRPALASGTDVWISVKKPFGRDNWPQVAKLFAAAMEKAGS